MKCGEISLTTDAVGAFDVGLSSPHIRSDDTATFVVQGVLRTTGRPPLERAILATAVLRGWVSRDE